MFKTLFFSIWFVFHPVHVTLTSIDFVKETDCFKVFVKIYFDDFLLDCRLNGIEINNTDFSVDNSYSQDIVETYLNKMLILKVNDKTLTGKLQSMKLSVNELSMDVEYAGRKNPKTVLVKNLIMADLYSDQSNMIIVRVNDFEEGVKLTSDITERTFKIK